MNLYIKHRKNHIRKLREERDNLFSIIDEVTYDEQEIILESITELTNTINKEKENIKELLNIENH